MSDDHILAHACSSKNRKLIEASELCGCFYCLKTFPSEEVTEWTGGGNALCPHCGIDSVIGDGSPYFITEELLEKMQQYWFQEAL